VRTSCAIFSIETILSLGAMDTSLVSSMVLLRSARVFGETYVAADSTREVFLGF